MLPKLLVSARMHRQWYAPGDPVRAELFLHCLQTTPDDEDGVLALSFGPAFNYFTGIPADVPVSLVVASLSSQVVGFCSVDPRRLRYALPSSVPLPAAEHSAFGDAFAAHHHVYSLFRSDEFPVSADLPLRAGETRALLLTFTLPGGLPPSFRGQCVRFYYGLHLRGEWRRPAGPAVPLRLCVPLRLVSPHAAIAPLLLPPLFPLGPFAFGFAARAAALAPVADPLRDAARPADAPHALGQRLAEQRTPLDIAVRIAGDHALSLATESSAVVAGAALRGEFVVHASHAARPVKVCGVVEQLECYRADLVQPGIVCHPLPGGEDGLVVAQTTVVSEHEWVLIDRIRVPFEVPFTNPNFCASMQTDVVTTCWQLRMRILWCTPQALAQRIAKQRTELTISEDQPELIVPLTVVPPPHPEQPSIGAHVRVLCAE